MNNTVKKQELALEEPETKQITETQTGEVTPMSMLKAAREQGASLEQMQQLMEMQFKWEENEARKAYYQAVAEFKAQAITITKDKVNKQFNSRYTGIGNLVNTVNPELSKFGLSAKWDIDQGEKMIKVTCILSHAKGHSEKVSLSALPDTSGGNSKNPIQQIKSTITYLKIATYEAITGIASMDDPGDDDGNSAGIALIKEQEAADLTALMQEVKADKDKFLEHFKIESVESLPASKLLEAKRKRVTQK